MKATAARDRLQEIAIAMVCVVPGFLLNYLLSKYALLFLRLGGVPTDHAALLVAAPLSVLLLVGRRAWRAARALRPTTPVGPTLRTGFLSAFVLGSIVSLLLLALNVLADHTIQAAMAQVR